MPNKLQELTDKLYNEGLSKGKEEGELLLKKAEEEAARTKKAAEEAAAAILEKAEKQAEDLKKKAESDIRMASAQCLQATKKDIENLLINSLAGEDVSSSVSDPDFLKEIIRAIAVKFDASETGDMNVILPEKTKDKLENWIRAELGKELGHGITAEFSKKISGGFTIGPADGSYFISFTDGTFRELIAEYIRPVTRRIIFGE